MISYEIDLAIVIIIFAAGLYLSIRNLKWGFFYALALIPLMHKELFSFIIWDLLPIRLAISALGLAGLTKLAAFTRRNGYIKVKEKVLEFVRADPFLLAMLILWVIRGLSIFKSQQPEYSLSLFAFYSIIIAFYVVFKYLINLYGESFYKKILYIYFAIAGFTAIFALYQYYLRICCREKIGAVWAIPGYEPRLGSTFWDVNHYGGFLITVIPLLFAYLFVVKKLYLRVVTLVGLALLSWLLFISQSRSAWIGLATGLGLSLLIYYWSKLRKPLVIVLTVFVLGIVGLLTYTTLNNISIRENIAAFMHYRLDSTDTHLMLLEGAAEVFFDNMWIGSGYGGFDPAFRLTETATDYFDREPALRDTKVPPHSIWGEVLGETGGLGLVTYGLFAVLIIGSLITSVFKAKSDELKYIGIGLLGSVIALFMGGLFYSYNIEFYWVTMFLAIGYVFINFKGKYDFSYIANWWIERKITPYLIIIPISIFYVFINLGSTTLIDWDEAIYAKVARNISTTGNWLTLYWDDLSKPWFEKPPFYMWLTSLIFKITNFNSLGARLISGVFGVLGIILTYKFGQKAYNKLTGITAALILMSTAHYLYYSRNGTLDVTVTFFILGTIYFMYRSFYSKNRASLLYAAIAGIFLGLGIMTKAVVGLIPVPVIVLYYLYVTLAKKEKASVMNLLSFAAVALIVAAPWHVYSYLVHGDKFVNEYFLKHILDRGFSGLGHEKPVWWFLEVIKVSFRIWIFPFILGILSLFYIDKRKRSEYILFALCSLFVLVFFSVSKDKLQWYIMPIYPFMAIIAARFIERFVYLLNTNLRKEVQFKEVYLRSFVVFAVFLVAGFYTVIIRDRVYFPDFNKDRVALIKIHNDMYKKSGNSDRRLYYVDMAPPVVLFYSDYRPKSLKQSDIYSVIDSAEPNENKDMLLPEGVYYDILNDDDIDIDAPVMLDVKGASGGWVLVKTKSRIDVLDEELSAIKIEVQPLQNRVSLGERLLPQERLKLDGLLQRREEIVNQMAEYGYPK